MNLTAKGTNGTLTFDGSFITITRTGLSRLTIGKGDKRIPLTAITGLDWKPAGPLINGYLQVSIPGGNEQRSKFGSRTFNATKDENSVVFTKSQQPGFEQVRYAIERALTNRSAPQGLSVADEVKKLADLVAHGLLTQEEFERQKAKLLSN